MLTRILAVIRLRFGADGKRQTINSPGIGGVGGYVQNLTEKQQERKNDKSQRDVDQSPRVLMLSRR
jgi:hypothetical protein